MAELPFGSAWRAECDQIKGLAGFDNMTPLIGRLVSAGMATLHELDTYYSLQDAMLMDEVLSKRNYNAWAVNYMEKLKHG